MVALNHILDGMSCSMECIAGGHILQKVMSYWWSSINGGHVFHGSIS